MASGLRMHEVCHRVGIVPSLMHPTTEMFEVPNPRTEEMFAAAREGRLFRR